MAAEGGAAVLMAARAHENKGVLIFTLQSVLVIQSTTACKVFVFPHLRLCERWEKYQKILEM